MMMMSSNIISIIIGERTKMKQQQQYRGKRRRCCCSIMTILFCSILVVFIYLFYLTITITSTTTTNMNTNPINSFIDVVTNNNDNNDQNKKELNIIDDHKLEQRQQEQEQFIPNNIHHNHHDDESNHQGTTTTDIFDVDENNEKNVCVSYQCIQQMALKMARPYKIRTMKSSWCTTTSSSTTTTTSTNNTTISSVSSSTKTKEKEEKEQGIILVKVTKAASSTSAGVVLRIAQRQSCNSNYIAWRHRMAYTISYQPKKTYLITTIREPAQRAISTIFFHVFSRQRSTTFQKSSITDELYIQQLQSVTHDHYGSTSNGQGGFQLRYIYPKYKIPENLFWDPNIPDQVQNINILIEMIQHIIETYDFIIIPERMDESLVVMALLLQIDVSDVLVTSSKVTGSQYHLLHPTHTTYTCILPMKSFITPTVQRYIESNIWRAMNYGDYLLYEVMNQSLNRTIYEVIGIERYTIALQRYKTLQLLEQQICAPYVQFPCSNDGIPQLSKAAENCYLYYYDFGCGYQCIDNMIQQYDNNNGTIV